MHPETLVLGIVLFSSGLYAQVANPDFPHDSHAFQRVAQEVQTRRVTALADFAHENAYPFYTLTQVLSHWLAVASGTDVQLALVLEEDGLTAETLQTYLQMGDIEAVLDRVAPYGSLERLEFYCDLRELYLRSQDRTEKRNKGDKAAFHIVGFEPFSLVSPADAFPADLPAEFQAGRTAVAKERDRQVASRLGDYLKQHPAEKVLAFYGAAHLRIRPIKQPSMRGPDGVTEVRQTWGCIVKKELGESFLSIAQMPFPASVRQPGSPYLALVAGNVFVTTGDIPWKLTRADPADYDGVIFLNAERIDEAHLMRHICSRRILKDAVESLDHIDTAMPNTLAAPFTARTLAGLRVITGRSFETAAQWKQWAEQNPYDGYARIDSNAFAEFVRSECCQPMNASRSTMLASLGLPPQYCGRQQQIPPGQWRDTVWPKLRPRVRFLQCLGIYWVGDPAEKARAREYLVEFSHQEFVSPEAYLKWYRETCLGVTFR
jgi:hypothetical protein